MNDYRTIWIVTYNSLQKAIIVTRAQLYPRVRKTSRLLLKQIANSHHKQDLFTNIKQTFVSNGIGLILGMLSAKIVGNYFAAKSARNLLGIFSQRTMVSETTFIALTFCVEFFVALVVFTISEHYVDEYKKYQ